MDPALLSGSPAGGAEHARDEVDSASFPYDCTSIELLADAVAGARVACNRVGEIDLSTEFEAWLTCTLLEALREEVIAHCDGRHTGTGAEGVCGAVDVDACGEGFGTDSNSCGPVARLTRVFVGSPRATATIGEERDCPKKPEHGGQGLP